MRRQTAVFVAIIFLISLIPCPALAATTYTVGDGESLDLATGVLTHADSTTETLMIYNGDTISVEAGAAAEISGTKKVNITCGAGVNLTLNSVVSDVSNVENMCSLMFSSGDNTLTLIGSSSFKSYEGWYTSIYSSKNGRDGLYCGGNLTIGGEGELKAYGGRGKAGIQCNGTLTIDSGSVYAAYMNSAATLASKGILAGDLVINDGSVEALCSSGSQAIYCSSSIEIKNGAVTARSSGCYGGGIICSNVMITGGTVYAHNNSYAGIGHNGDDGTITITGGSVTASGNDGAGIGGNRNYAGGTIDISGGIVTATSYSSAGIGGGKNGAGGTINISGGEVYADGGTNAQDIGAGEDGNGGTLSIGGSAAVFTREDPTTRSLIPTTTTHERRSDETISENTAYGYTHVPDGWTGTAYAYISAPVYTLVIDDDYVDVHGSTTDLDAIQSSIDTIQINTTQAITIRDSAATDRDIQIKAVCSGVDLTVDDVRIDIKNFTYGCALSFTGAGNFLTLVGDSAFTSSGDPDDGEPGIQVEGSTELTIGSTSGGTVEAKGGTLGAGIGGGFDSTGGHIYITGGTVKANGGYGAAGIGGGHFDTGGSVAISGGIVHAKGGTYGAGIGGGATGSGGNIEISGGEVYADGDITNGAQDIGAGSDGSGGTLAISSDAAVFTRDDPTTYSLIPTTNTHVLRSDETIAEGTPYGSAYGFAHVPEEWTGTAYAYLVQTVLVIDDDYVAAHGSTTDIDAIFSSIDTIQIDTTQAITIKDTAAETREIEIEAVCSGVNLTIDDVHLDVSGVENGCALAFTGAGNTLTLVGDSEFTSWGANSIGGEPGIRVESGAALTIESDTDGSVTATGGMFGAGIGGGLASSGGSITITGGNVNAYGDVAAGIGGGYYGGCGSFSISDGCVTATGGDYGAGIGGGYDNANSSCDIAISGGIVSATGGATGAGIGGGYGGAGGGITISGGKVYADGNTASGAQDIGAGYSGSGGTLAISGDAAVFMKHDVCIAPETGTHTHEIISSVTGDKVYGVSANGWEPGFGVYMRLYTLDYDVNEGSGALPDAVTQHIGTTATVGSNSGLERDRYDIEDNWNTQVDGGGDTYAAGDTFTFTEETTLFAMWDEIRVSSVTLSSTWETMQQHDTLTLTVAVLPDNAMYPDVTWESSDTDVATVDQSGKVTAVAVGSVTIMATADGVSGTCTVTVEKKPVSSVTLSSDAERIRRGRSLTLTAVVLPDNATYPDVTWESSDTDVATVDQSGVVTAVNRGSATITATADGVSGTCDVTVYVPSAATSEPIETPIPTVTPTTQPEPTDAPEPTVAPTAAPTDGADIVGVQIIGEDGDTVVIEIDIDDLPKGAAAVQLPNGEIVDLYDTDLLHLTLKKDDISGGKIELIALDDEGLPLGAFDVQIEDTAQIVVPDAGDAWNGIWPVLMWIGISVGAGGLALLVYAFLKRRRV